MSQVVSAARYWVSCEGWATGLGFSELAGFTTAVESHEYSYSGLVGNIHTKQFGRPRPPQIMLKRALDKEGFAQLFGWHMLARLNNPLAKLPAIFTIMGANGDVSIVCTLENAWCAKLDIDSAQAGSSNVVMMKATIECDSILIG